MGGGGPVGGVRRRLRPGAEAAAEKRSRPSGGGQDRDLRDVPEDRGPARSQLERAAALGRRSQATRAASGRQACQPPISDMPKRPCFWAAAAYHVQVGVGWTSRSRTAGCDDSDRGRGRLATASNTRRQCPASGTTAGPMWEGERVTEARMSRIPIAIVGSGNIGTDLAAEAPPIVRPRTGRDGRASIQPRRASTRARQWGMEASADGVDWLLANRRPLGRHGGLRGDVRGDPRASRRRATRRRDRRDRPDARRDRARRSSRRSTCERTSSDPTST